MESHCRSPSWRLPKGEGKGSTAVERRRFVVGLGERGPRIRFPAGVD
ncbi:hypothetical protein IG631_03134 [Alternaria alternata]|nr:hypothetical protein IG631_03134 [Alternaria alternata]